jgi:hypothetical protein
MAKKQCNASEMIKGLAFAERELGCINGLCVVMEVCRDTGRRGVGIRAQPGGRSIMIHDGIVGGMRGSTGVSCTRIGREPACCLV